MSSKEKIRRATYAIKALRDAHYGADTWMVFPKAIDIVRHSFEGKLTCKDWVLELETARKGSKAKHSSDSVKGGKIRIKSRPVLQTQEIKDIKQFINENLPESPTKRSEFLRSEQFDQMRSDLCEQNISSDTGKIIYCLIACLKKQRKHSKGVYFLRDPLRPNEYNIGRTTRGAEQRLKDTGSKGRHWEVVAFSSHISESEAHKALRRYKDNNGRGSETFILDERAQDIAYHKLGVELPIS